MKTAKEKSSTGDTSVRVIKEMLESTDCTDISRYSTLKSLKNIENNDERSNKLIEYLFDINKSGDSSIYRLCDQLYGHVEFLERLFNSFKTNSDPSGTSCETQSLFLISQCSGNTFLRQSTRDIILEQASRTTELISTMITDPLSPLFGFGKTFGTDYDPSLRTSSLKEILSKNYDALHHEKSSEISNEELRATLLQEAYIVEMLIRYYQFAEKQKTQTKGSVFDDSPKKNFGNNSQKMHEEDAEGIEEKYRINHEREMHELEARLREEFSKKHEKEMQELEAKYKEHYENKAAELENKLNKRLILEATKAKNSRNSSFESKNAEDALKAKYEETIRALQEENEKQENSYNEKLSAIDAKYKDKLSKLKAEVSELQQRINEQEVHEEQSFDGSLPYSLVRKFYSTDINNEINAQVEAEKAKIINGLDYESFKEIFEVQISKEQEELENSIRNEYNKQLTKRTQEMKKQSEQGMKNTQVLEESKYKAALAKEKKERKEQESLIQELKLEIENLKSQLNEQNDYSVIREQFHAEIENEINARVNAATQKQATKPKAAFHIIEEEEEEEEDNFVSYKVTRTTKKESKPKQTSKLDYYTIRQIFASEIEHEQEEAVESAIESMKSTYERKIKSQAKKIETLKSNTIILQQKLNEKDDSSTMSYDNEVLKLSVATNTKRLPQAKEQEHETNTDVESIREEIKQELLPILEKDIKRKFSQTLRIKIRNELEEELRESIEQELRSKIRKEFEAEYKARNASKESDDEYNGNDKNIIRKVRRTIIKEIREEFLNGKRVEAKNDRNSEISIDFNSSESSINDYGFDQNKNKNKKVDDFSSSEDENDDIKALKRDIEASFLQQHDNKHVEYDSKYIQHLIALVCDALSIPEIKIITTEENGVATTRAEYTTRTSKSRQTVIAVNDHGESTLFELTERLAKDVNSIRDKFTITGPLFEAFRSMRQQITHLDTLCTQTRALLTRQAEVISQTRRENKSRVHH